MITLQIGYFVVLLVKQHCVESLTESVNDGTSQISLKLQNL
jgi:hypothetical protein